MKAIKYYGTRNMKMEEIVKPVPDKNQALVKVVYCGICGTDIHAYSHEGFMDWEMVMGHETVGIVEAIGSDVTCVKVGDRVAVGPPGDCGNCYACNTGHPNICSHAFPNTKGIGPNTQGAFAEYVLAQNPQAELYPIPDALSFESAALFDVMGVGIHAVRASTMHVGDNVVVSGCGSIGLSVIQFANLAGARNLIAFDLNEERRRQAKAAGADYTLDPTNETDCALAQSLLASTGGAQVTFEAAGAAGSVSSCINYTMPGGQVMLIGTDSNPYPLVTAALNPMEYDLKLSFTYTKEEIKMLFDFLSSGKLTTDIYTIQKAPLAEAINKMEQLTSGKLNISRVLLMPDSQ